MKNYLFIIVLGAIYLHPVQAQSMKERYPAPWQEEFNIEISKTLVSHNVRGCGEYKYRESSRNRGEYLVRCTNDGKNWHTYVVWIYANKILGPYKSEPSLD